MRSSQQKFYLGVLWCGILLLAGCQATAKKTHQPETVSIQAPVNSHSEVATPKVVEEPKTSQIGLCQSELASLKQINPKAYAAKQAHFNRLVNNASLYNSVRGEVNPATKDTIDALYKYKTNQLCADIAREVMQGLIQKGEG
ncbi:hypothetical protein [Serratia sp. DD3]|uniref:hypothetical protein n=1 Tax=Serratia sp. DD3 TaxID=1410619 RepID=UPI0003C4F6E3|nr:hypothetical protein [Serratia sp. DD3]KEY56632.1 hypothetical protein SRDD_44420 [Serratia sp. DD3]